MLLHTASHSESPGLRKYVVAAASCLVALLVVAACTVSPPPSLTSSDKIRASTKADESNVAYGPLAEQRLDVYRSTASGESIGTILFVHGGGFETGDRTDIADEGMSVILALRSEGFDIVAADYRLAPKYPFPAAFDDVALALRWVKGRSSDWRINTSNIIVAGHSAGGAIAAMIGTKAGASTQYGPVPRVLAWIAVSAITNFENAASLAVDYPARWGISTSAQRRINSPITNIDAGDPPGYLIHANRDFIVNVVQSDAFMLVAASRGADITYDRITRDPLNRDPIICLSHQPLCAADRSKLLNWLDDMVSTAG